MNLVSREYLTALLQEIEIAFPQPQGVRANLSLDDDLNYQIAFQVASGWWGVKLEESDFNMSPTTIVNWIRDRAGEVGYTPHPEGIARFSTLIA